MVSIGPAEEKPGKLSRITEVDVLRGFALFGITIVNTVGITGMPTADPAGNPGAAYWAYETLLQQRFLPIFSFLFGLSFGLFLDSIRDRTPNPRLIMLARLGFLIPFGALHRLLQPDEVLLTYAIVGIIVLLPASFVPGWRILLALGAVATGVAASTAGGSTLIPGFFLVGFAIARYGIGRILDAPTVCVARAFLVSIAFAAALNMWQISASADSGSVLAVSAGMATAVTYMVTVLLLLRSRAGRPLRALAPLGKTALTSYIGATVAIIAAEQFVGLKDSPDYRVAIAVGTSIVLLELAFSRLWLRHARYGPLEWVWRCLTWWNVKPPSASREAV